MKKKKGEEEAATWVGVEELKRWEENPRKNKAAISHVAESIERFGFASPIIARAEDKMIIAGHTRYEAALKLGLQSVPVRFMDLSKADSKLLALADNKTAEIAEWDEEELEKVLQSLVDEGHNVEGLGWNEDELQELIDLSDPTEGEEADAPEVREDEEPISQLGEVYQLGEHVLICGDCTDVNNWPDKDKNIMLFTSPPYMATNSSLTGNTKMKQKYQHKEEVGYKFINLMNSFTEIAVNICGQVYINTQLLADNKKILLEYMYKNREIFCDLLIWDKTHGQPAMAKNVCNSVFELIIVLSKINNTRSMMFSEFRGTQSNIIRTNPNKNRNYSHIHSAVMSLDFCIEIISSFGKNADLIIDCFGGIGTTLISCEKLNKKSYLIEKNPLYCDVIRRRWAQYAAENNLEIGDGLDG